MMGDSTIITNVIVEDNSSIIDIAIATLRRLSKTLLTTKIFKKGSGLQEITLREVAQHDDASSCWIIIYDRVYDITQFLDSVSMYFKYIYFSYSNIIHINCFNWWIQHFELFSNFN